LDNIEVVYDRLARYNVDFMFSVNFSMYDNYPPFDRLVNLKRGFKSIEALQARGVKIVPDVGWLRPVDVERCAAWVRDNDVPVVSLNMQTVRRMRLAQLEKDVEYIHMFLEKVGRPVRIIFFGASGSKYMSRFINEFKNVSFVDAMAYRYAEFKRYCYGDRGWNHDMSKKEHFLTNAEYLFTFYDTLQEEMQDGNVSRL